MAYQTGRVKKHDKELLEDTGLWMRFVEERELNRSTGMEPKVAKAEALAKYIPMAEKIKESNTPAAIGVSGAGEELTGNKPALIIPDEVMNNPHDAVASIEYVAKYLEIGVTAENIGEAPCAAAVSMLRSYSDSKSRKNIFWDDIHIKLIAKSDLERKEKETYDGEILQKLAGKIVKDMEKYKEEANAEN